LLLSLRSSLGHRGYFTGLAFCLLWRAQGNRGAKFLV
jgi:hypothetical protein